VPAGSTVALVGPSGSGKTTVTNLVARFYTPTEGVVLVNDVDVRRFPLRAYRRRLAMVHQDVFLFDGTVRDNISYGRRGASADAIFEAARRAQAHDFIESLPEGYETRIGERGVRLSGGQAQRIAIARALLADPQILILDEATSNLDAESEARVQQAIAALIHDRTTLIIAHRLSTVVHADRILVFEGGRIIATGTHESLLAESARYREMVATQFTAEMR
jgi:ATP-binding cassette subfamily B protein/subfamily B ATP-binding cassette protein MsbA